jgi:hypothetical protein
VHQHQQQNHDRNSTNFQTPPSSSRDESIGKVLEQERGSTSFQGGRHQLDGGGVPPLAPPPRIAFGSIFGKSPHCSGSSPESRSYSCHSALTPYKHTVMPSLPKINAKK